MVRRGVLAWACFALLAAPAAAQQDAIVQRDVLKLEALSTGTGEQAQLAKGAAFSLRHKDEQALTTLLPLSQSAANPEIRSGACLALADLYLRQGRYSDLRSALECAQPLNAEGQQVLDYARALEGEKPMRLAVPASGRIGVRRDTAGLLRVPVEINGQSKSAVLDTDASFCVTSESQARRLGLRLLDRPLTIITATRSDQPMRLAVADRLQFGDAVLENVVFAVLPDAAVRFGPSYSMDTVIGLPVFVALHRLELAPDGWGETLTYGPGRPTAGEANLILSGLDPFVLAKGPEGAVLRLALDTAADTTALNATALADYPGLAHGSAKSAAEWRGAGGSELDRDALVLRSLTLAIADRPVTLHRVRVHARSEIDRHGAIGQDLLRRGNGWILDFDAMTFRLRD